MSRPRSRWLLAGLLCWSCSGGCGGGRYRLAADSGSRYGFEYPQDRATGLWVVRETEVRVTTQRRLPDPLSDPAHGDQLHSSFFTPGATGTGNLSPTKFEIREGYRTWRFREPTGDDDLTGHRAFGVQVEWRHDGRPSEWEPMEIFVYPPLGDTPPEAWSEWRTATAHRDGGFAWWEEVHEHAGGTVVAVPHPFEIRWRLQLTDRLVID